MRGASIPVYVGSIPTGQAMETIVNTYRAETVERKGRHAILREFIAQQEHPYWYVSNAEYDPYDDTYRVVFKEMTVEQYYQMRRKGYIVGNSLWY